MKEPPQSQHERAIRFIDDKHIERFDEEFEDAEKRVADSAPELAGARATGDIEDPHL